MTVGVIERTRTHQGEEGSVVIIARIRIETRRRLHIYTQVRIYYPI